MRRWITPNAIMFLKYAKVHYCRINVHVIHVGDLHNFNNKCLKLISIFEILNFSNIESCINKNIIISLVLVVTEKCCGSKILQIQNFIFHIAIRLIAIYNLQVTDSHNNLFRL